MQNGDQGLSSIILAGSGLLVKVLITLELHGILIKFSMLIYFNITEIQVCETVTMLRQEKRRSEHFFINPQYPPK